MYSVKQVHFNIVDTSENVSKLLSHKNILVTSLHIGDFWIDMKLISRRATQATHKEEQEKTFAFSGWIKIKHTRRYKEIEHLWHVEAADILNVVK